MTRYIAGAALLAAALVFQGWGSARADEKDHVLEGAVHKVAEHKLTVVGADKKEHTVEVPKEAKVTLDGKDAKLDDLKPHSPVKVTMKVEGGRHVVTKVEVTTKKDK